MESTIKQVPSTEDKVRHLFYIRIARHKLRPNECSDRFLKNFQFYEPRKWLAKQISKLWIDIFKLYGWKEIEFGVKNRQLDLFSEERKAIDGVVRRKASIIEVKNNWKTCNFDEKQSKFKTLKEHKIKYPDYEIIYGCINDFQERDYINKDGVRVLTSDNFLKYMLGDNWIIINNLLIELLRDYIIKNKLAA